MMGKIGVPHKTTEFVEQITREFCYFNICMFRYDLTVSSIDNKKIEGFRRDFRLSDFQFRV